MKRSISLLLAMTALMILSPRSEAAKGAEAKIISVNLKNDHDSSGRKIKAMTVVTEQSKVPMWGTLRVAVLVKDKDGTEYFGSSDFRQPQRSGNTAGSLDKWQFNIVVEKLTNADVSAYSVQYSNTESAKVMDTKNKNIKPPDNKTADNKKMLSAATIKATLTTDEWIKSNTGKSPLTITPECHWVMH